MNRDAIVEAIRAGSLTPDELRAIEREAHAAANPTEERDRLILDHLDIIPEVAAVLHRGARWFDLTELRSIANEALLHAAASVNRAKTKPGKLRAYLWAKTRFKSLDLMRRIEDNRKQCRSVLIHATPFSALEQSSSSRSSNQRFGDNVYEVPSIDAPNHEIDDEWLTCVCRVLNKAEKAVVRRHFIDGETLKAVGKEIGLTESRISQMTREVRRKMQKRFGSREVMAAA